MSISRIKRRNFGLKQLLPSSTLLVAIWNMLQTGDAYHDLGSDYFTQRDPEKTKNRALNQLRDLGYSVTIEAQHGTA